LVAPASTLRVLPGSAILLERVEPLGKSIFPG
jgi:hypothetical protein